MLTLDQKSLQRRSLARNETLFRQGDQAAAIYFVDTGRLRLERRTFDGRPLVLGTTGAGEFFAEAALFLIPIIVMLSQRSPRAFAYIRKQRC